MSWKATAYVKKAATGPHWGGGRDMSDPQRAAELSRSGAISASAKNRK